MCKYIVFKGGILSVCLFRGFSCGSVVKNPPANVGDVGSVPESGSLLGKGMATHSSILAWEIPWTEKPSRLQPTRS